MFLKRKVIKYLPVYTQNGTLAIDSGGHVYEQSSLRALIIAYGWMLPREAEMVSECLSVTLFEWS